MLLSHEVTVGLDVLAQRAGVCVALQAAHHLTVIGLVHIVRARVLEAVAGVGVTLVATLVRTDVGLFSCREISQLYKEKDQKLKISAPLRYPPLPVCDLLCILRFSRREKLLLQVGQR